MSMSTSRPDYGPSGRAETKLDRSAVPQKHLIIILPVVFVDHT